MKRILVISILLFALTTSLAISIVNYTDVSVNYFFGEFKAPLSFLIFSALLAGLMLGLIVNVVAIFRLKRQLKQLKRQTDSYVAELAKLRRMPIRDLT